MKKLIIIFIAAMSCLAAGAQQTPASVVFDVNGLKPGKHYTDAQIRAALGEPTRYKTWDDEFGGGRTYQYGPEERYDLFRYQKEDGLLDISIETPRFTMFGGKLRIGDHISRMLQLGGGLLKLEKPNTYRFYTSGSDTPDEWIQVETDDNGIIQTLSRVYFI